MKPISILTSSDAAFIRGFGAYVPARVVTNEELATRLGAEPAWIESVSGIEQRRYAADGESVADLAVRAGEDCLERAGMAAASVGMLIVSSGSAERRFPGPAATVAHRLGCQQVPALDLPMASAGSLFGMALASRLASAQGHILVIGAEKMSSVALREPVDRNSAVLFGDGAGACLISRQPGPAQILDSALYSDGAFAEALRLEFEQPLAMDGRTVILQAARKIPRAITDLLERHGRRAAEVDVFLMHQANQNLIVRVAQALGVNEAKFYSNIRRYGNTSSASMLIAAQQWSEQSGFRPAIPVVFATFGAGFHWGALLAMGT